MSNINNELDARIRRNIFQDVRPAPRKEDCLFYHSFDLAGQEPIVGEWDMRGKFDEYIGHVDLNDKLVLDIGTASGFLSFESEKRGAKVVSFDADSTARYTRLPHASGRYMIDPEGAIQEDNKWLAAVKNSYWYAYNALHSQNLVYYGDVHNLTRFKNVFDVAIVGQFLVHNRSGIDIIESVASTTRDYLIITEGSFESPGPSANFLGRADRPNDFFSNWLYSSSFFIEVTKMLGFYLESKSEQTYLCNHATHASEIGLSTFVFRRKI